MIKLYRLLLPLLAAATLAAAAHADGEHVAMAGEFADDVYLAGENVTVNANAGGDVIVAGGHVRISKRVGGDVAAAGGQVEIDAQVDDDVRAVGGQVRLDGQTAGDALAAGGSVRLAPQARVDGRAWFAGGSVEVAGVIAGELRAAGGEVILAGQVDGDARIYAKTLKVLPGARIGGRLDYYGPTAADIAPEAVIGTLSYHPLEGPAEEADSDRGFALMFYFLLGITGVALYLIFPHFALAAAAALGERPGASFGIGLAALLAIPPAIVLLLMTLVGLLLGLLLLGFYALLVLAGFLTGLLFLGDRLLRLLRHGGQIRHSKRLLSLIAAVLIVWLAGFVPVAGGLAVILLLVLGTGAVLRQVWRVYRGPGEVSK